MADPSASATSFKTPTTQKKLRKKRKQLDALVPDDKIRRKNSFVGGNLVGGDSDDTEGGRLGLLAAGRNNSSHIKAGVTGLWGLLPGVLVIMVMVGTAVMSLAALRLLMTTRRDMELLTRRLGSVEARSSELPARFHEAHLRLQQLQHNSTSLWEELHGVLDNLTSQQHLVASLQEELLSLQKSVQAAPPLSSLPQDVKALQSSVATIGSTLQDVQSALRAVRGEHKATEDVVESMKASIITLEESTRVNSTNISKATIGYSVAELQRNLRTLNTSLSALNSTSWKQFEAIESTVKESISNLTSGSMLNCELSKNTSTAITALREEVTSLTGDIRLLQSSSSSYSSQLQELMQNISVVKGVEKKLEGSQLQLASSVSVVKQQVQAIQNALSSFPHTTPAGPEKSSSQPESRSTG